MSEVVVKLELALSLQLRTNELTDDDLLVTDWPFGSSENTVSSANSDQIVQGGDGDSSSKPENPTVSGSLNYRIFYKNIKFPLKLPKINFKKWKIPKEYPEVHSGQLRRFSLSELEVATDEFSNRHSLGRDEFGKVYKGRLVDGTLVAAKRLDLELTIDQFTAEVEMISCMAVHRNLLRLQGFCATPTERILVYPYMANGTVASWLRERLDTQSPLDWSKRQHIALGSARGLAYLHDECDPKIIHRDVKAANILLDEDFVAVVGGFSFTKLIDHEDTFDTRAIMGTMVHTPEYLSTGKKSKKTDVFDYGLVLLELITGQRAFHLALLAADDDAMLHDWVKGVLKENKVETLVDADLNGNYIEEVEQLIQVALLCIQDSRYKRPQMSEVIRMLEGHGLSESWEKWQNEEVYWQEYNNAHHPNADWIIYDSTINLRPEVLSGPR